MEEGKEECHEKVVASLVDVPQEVCDLNPVKTCRFATKLVPHLSPTHQCTIVPREVCVLKFSTPREVRKPLLTKWCLDPQEPAPGESYEEENAFAPVLSSGSAPQSYGVPPPAPTSNPPPPESYGAPTPDYPAPDSYGAPTSDYSAPPSGREPETGYSAPAVSSPAGEGYAAPSTGYDGPAQASGPPVYGEYEESYDYNYEEIDPLGDIYAVNSVPPQDYNIPAVNARDFSAPTSQPVRDYSAPDSRYRSPSPSPAPVSQYRSPSPSASPDSQYSSPAPAPVSQSYSSPQLRLRTGRLGRTGRRHKMMPRRFPRGAPQPSSV